MPIKLFALHKECTSDEPTVFGGDFCSRKDADESGYSWYAWAGTISGRDCSEYDLVEDLCPVVEIESPSREWRDKFISEYMKGNIYERLLLTHPAFQGIMSGESRIAL